MTERSRIRRNAIATLRRAYASEAQSALRAYLQWNRINRRGSFNRMTPFDRRGLNVDVSITRAERELASIGLEYYIDAGEVCTRPALSRCSSAEWEYRIGVEIGTIEPY